MVPALVGRISFTGDLGYEIWVKPDYQRALYRRLARRRRGARPAHFGARALHSLRLEKSFGTWAREYRPIYDRDRGRARPLRRPAQGRLRRPRGGAARARERAGTHRLVSFAVDADRCRRLGDEPIWHDGKVVGWVTSGGYAHTHGVSLAMGYVRGEVAPALDGLTIEIIGEGRRARRLEEPVFDPDGLRMRA